MDKMEQLRNTLTHAMSSLAEGWQALKERAGQALTRFNPADHGDELQSAEQQVALHSARWGLLAAEVREDDTKVMVRLEVPGMEAADFDIDVFDGRLLQVRGEKRVERTETQGRFHVMECAYGAFERVIPLPADVDEAGASAGYRHGVLRIELPKIGRSSRARRIDVEIG